MSRGSLSWSKKLLFTAGQFARIHDVNKRTLQYYDDIGLFRPQVRGENNYRYYSYQQSPELELILTLREMNMSLPEIESYLQHPSPLSLAELVETKTAELRLRSPIYDGCSSCWQKKRATAAFLHQCRYREHRNDRMRGGTVAAQPADTGECFS